MKFKYCLPIIKTKQSEIIKIIEDNPDYDFYEIWLDYIEDIDDSFIKSLLNTMDGKLIFLFRRQNLEKIKMDINKRLEIIALLKNKKSFIDLDIQTQKEELGYIKQKLQKPVISPRQLAGRNLNAEISHSVRDDNLPGLKSIVSYHNYKETPSKEKLLQIIEDMKPYNPAIYKIATMCKSKKDSLTLLNLILELKEKGVKYIVLGMSELGTITRIFGTLWGNELVFAPRQVSESSAPGQLTKQELEKIFSTLNNAN